MDYAVMENSAIVTRQGIQTKKELPQSVRERQNFLRTHDFSVSVDKETKKMTVNVSEKK